MNENNYWQRKLTRRHTLSRVGLVGLGTAGIAIVGCGDDDDDDDGSAGPSSTATSASQSTATSAPTQDSDVDLTASLTSGIGSDVGTMDPQAVGGGGGGNWPNLSTHFQGPLGFDPATSEVIGLAADWAWVDNNTGLTLKAKPGIKFHNGEPFNAEQIKFNFDRQLGRAAYNPKFGAGTSNLAAIGEVKVVDEMTVRLELTGPDVVLPSKIAAAHWQVPKAYVEKVGDEGFAANPVGLGPFKFVSRVADSEIKSVRYDEFFNGRDQKYGPRLPWIQSLNQRVIPEDAARIAALETGEIDLAHNVNSDIAKSFEGRSDFHVFVLPGEQPMHLQPNTTQETAPGGGPNPWPDLRVRKAANMAVDLDTIIKTLLTGSEKRSFGSAQRSIGFPTGLPAKAFKYDVTQAKALMAEAGFANGFDTNLYYPIGRWPNTEPVVQAVASYLEKVGIRAKLQAQQYQATVNGFKERTNDGLTFFGMASGADPGFNFRAGYYPGATYTLSYNPDLGIDKFIEDSEKAFDLVERKRLIGEIITKFYEDASWIFLYEPVTIVIAKAKKIQWEYYTKVLANPEYWNIRITKS